jgi:hypothetical protein
MEKQITLTITKRVPKDYRVYYPAVCLADGEFYFGWKDKSATIFPLGQAIQKAMILMSQNACNSVRLVIEKEFSDTGKQEELVINRAIC